MIFFKCQLNSQFTCKIKIYISFEHNLSLLKRSKLAAISNTESIMECMKRALNASIGKANIHFLIKFSFLTHTAQIIPRENRHIINSINTI